MSGSGEWTHLDDSGRARMVEVGAKPETPREARARARVTLRPETYRQLVEGALPKGDAEPVVRLAGIMAAKKASDLIPLCHPLALSGVEVEILHRPPGSLEIEAVVRCHGKTGVEMEALTAVSVAALALYDMVKAVDRGVSIGPVHLMEKSGGRSGHWKREDIMEQSYFAHESACIDRPCEIGAGTKIWHFSHVMKDAVLGRGCVLGQNVMVASHVRIGNNVKIQNNVSVYTGVELEDDVFCGPSCVFTNVLNPRSQIVRKDEYRPTLVRRGATIGANATVVCGGTVGRYAFVGAGAVVRGDVPDYALMLGVPARRLGWMSRHGYRLEPAEQGLFVCPGSGWRYREVEPERLVCLDWPEDRPLE